MNRLAVFTVGSTQTSAENFFGRLRTAGVKRIIDVRLHNTSQLAGFAKAGDLAYFPKSIGRIDYGHEPLLAPTEAMPKAFKSGRDDWDAYAKKFLALMKARKIEARVSPELLDRGCLLCSEAKPHQCHRRLVFEYLNEKWGRSLGVTHL